MSDETLRDIWNGINSAQRNAVIYTTVGDILIAAGLIWYLGWPGMLISAGYFFKTAAKGFSV